MDSFGNKLLDILLYPVGYFKKLTNNKASLYVGIVLIGLVDLLLPEPVARIKQIFAGKSITDIYVNIVLMVFMIILLGIVDVAFVSIPLADFFKYLKDKELKIDIKILKRMQELEQKRENEDKTDSRQGHESNNHEYGSDARVEEKNGMEKRPGYEDTQADDQTAEQEDGYEHGEESYREHNIHENIDVAKRAGSQAAPRIKMMKIYIMSHFVIIPVVVIIHHLFVKGITPLSPPWMFNLLLIYTMLTAIWAAAILTRGINVLFNFNLVFRRLTFIIVFSWSFLFSLVFEVQIMDWLLKLFR